MTIKDLGEVGDDYNCEDCGYSEPAENDPCGECGHLWIDHYDSGNLDFPVIWECWHGEGSSNRCACREFVQREED